MSIHLVLLTLSCCALAAAAAGGQLAGLTTDSLRARQVALLVSGALVTGNAVCLLPDTPVWYSAAVVALTCAGLVWLAISTLAVRRAARQQAAPGQRVPAASQRVPAEAPSVARPHLAVLPGGLSDQATPTTTYRVVEATPVPDSAAAAGTATSATRRTDRDGVVWDTRLLAAYLSERTVVTRADLDTIGSPGARAQSVEVARLIGRANRRPAVRRAEGSAFGPRTHTAHGAVLRARLRSVYEDVPAPRRDPGARA